MKKQDLHFTENLKHIRRKLKKNTRDNEKKQKLLTFLFLSVFFFKRKNSKKSFERQSLTNTEDKLTQSALTRG